MAMKFGARRLRTVGAEAGTGRHRSFRLPTLRCELGNRLSHPVNRAAPFRAAMLGSPSVHTVCRPTLGGGGAPARPHGELFMKKTEGKLRAPADSA